MPLQKPCKTMANHHQNGVQKGLKQQDVVVVMVPFPAQGHLNQLLQLSRLVLAYNIPVHYVGAASHNRQAKVRIHVWDPLEAANLHFHDFEVPPFLCPPPDPNATVKFPSHLQPSWDATVHLRHSVAELLRFLSCKARKVIVIHDSIMGHVIQDVPLIPNAESYTFHSVSAFACFLYIWEKMGNTVESIEHIPSGIPSLEGCFTDEFLDFIASQYTHLQINSGNIYNTSRVIEGTYMKMMELETLSASSKHWALGPFNPVTIEEKKGSSTAKRHHCLEWLDKQAPNSVIYVSFGTTTAMSDEQIKELAIGLKRSNQKFIWVLRDADRGDIFKGGDDVKRADLPKGYEDSVKAMGLIVRDWAPQLELLAHPSTGAFVSHCGWNSCLESITMGVPIGAWPMHSDQPRNTVLVTQVLKIGIVVKKWEKRDEIVTAPVVESAIKRLMASKEGDELRKRAAEIGYEVRQSVSEGGVSRTEFDAFIAHISK